MAADDTTPETDFILPDGVYFNMPAAQYHSLRRLSNSAMQKLDKGAAYFWKDSWLNPDAVDEDTEARRIGRAYHTAVLEPGLLEKLFMPEFDALTMGKGAVTNATEITAKLEEMGEKGKLKSEKVLDQAKRLAATGFPASKILHLAAPLYAKTVGDKTLIPRNTFDDINSDIDAMEQHPDIVKYLRMGYSEVTILWTDEKTGEKMKARLDRVWETGFSDLKTFVNMLGKRLSQCLSDAIKYNRYHMQMATYWTALEIWRAGGLHLRGECTAEQIELFKAITENPRKMECVWIWQEKKTPNFLASPMETHKYDVRTHRVNDAGIDEAKSIEIAEKTARPSSWFVRGLNDARHAIDVYQLAMEIYGTDQPWNDINPVRKITDDDFSSFWLDE